MKAQVEKKAWPVIVLSKRMKGKSPQEKCVKEYIDQIYGSSYTDPLSIKEEEVIIRATWCAYAYVSRSSFYRTIL